MLVLLVMVLASTPGMMNGYTIGFLLFVGLALLGAWSKRKDAKRDAAAASQRAADQAIERLREQELADKKREQEGWERDFLRLQYPGMTDQEAKRAAEMDAMRERAMKRFEEDRERFMKRRYGVGRDAAGDSSTPKSD